MKNLVAMLLTLSVLGGITVITLQTPVGEIFDVASVEQQIGAPLPYEPTDTLGDAAKKSFDYIMSEVEWAMGVYEQELGNMGK